MPADGCHAHDDLGARLDGLPSPAGGTCQPRPAWDKAIPRDAVLIHALSGPNALIMASDAVNHVNDWRPGQTYSSRSALGLALYGGIQIHIDSLDLNAKTARITVTVHAHRPIVEGPAEIFGGVAQDGGGLIVLPSGKIVRVPPRSPVLEALVKLAVAADTEALSPRARDSVERAVFDDVAKLLRASKRSTRQQS